METPTLAKENVNPLVQKELTVSVAGETYQFKIWSDRDKAKIGSIARFLRAQDDPEHIGSAEGLDFNTYIIYEAYASIQVLLLRASTSWPFSAGKDGKPVINPDEFPADAPVVEVYEGYLDALATFREASTKPESAGESTPVDSQPDTQS